MAEHLSIGGFDVEVTKKDIKNIHLTVHPPTGVVKVSAPLETDTQIVKAFALTKLEWIKRHHQRLANQARESQRELINRESINVWGQRYLLKIESFDSGDRVELKGKLLILRVRDNENTQTKTQILERWYRDELRKQASKVISQWESQFSASVQKLYIQRMKTKWGSCSPVSNSIRLNTELVHKEKEALEFVIVHELIHFIEAKHNEKFYRLLDSALPKWNSIRQKLNEAPLSYATWSRLG